MTDRLPDGLYEQAHEAFVDAEGRHGGGHAPIEAVLHIGYQAGRRKAADLLGLLPGSEVWRIVTGENTTAGNTVCPPDCVSHQETF
jgi:hypothetical protein